MQSPLQSFCGFITGISAGDRNHGQIGRRQFHQRPFETAGVRRAALTFLFTAGLQIIVYMLQYLHGDFFGPGFYGNEQIIVGSLGEGIDEQSGRSQNGLVFAGCP